MPGLGPQGRRVSLNKQTLQKRGEKYVVESGITVTAEPCRAVDTFDERQIFGQSLNTAAPIGDQCVELTKRR